MKSIDDIITVCRERAANPDAEREGKLQREERAYREALERGRREALRLRSYVPARYLAARLDTLDRTPDNTAAIDAAVGVAARRYTGSVAFYGAVGCGKSTIAAALVNGAVDELIPAKMLKAASIFDELHEATKYSSADEVSEIIADFARTPVLMLDDLGRETLSRRDYIVWLGELLDRRWDACRPLIVTSNFGLGDLYARYAGFCERAGEPTSTAEAIVDRLRGIVPANAWVEVGGETRR